jgi:predicted nucleic acid-binding protein
MASISRLQETVAEQQLALIRLFFYRPETLFVTPTVVLECSRIRKVELAELHRSFINVLFGELRPNNPSAVQSRANALRTAHNRQNDCLVLAEAEDVKHNVLLSFDADFVRRLSRQTNAVVLTRPAEYWKSLDTPHGQPPVKIPHPTNPLSEQDWWRW